MMAAAAHAQGWTAPVLISDMAGINVNQDMCIDRAGTRHVVWSHTVSAPYRIIMYSKSTNGGASWSVPDTIANMPASWLYEPHIVSDTLNNLYVSFDSISWSGGYAQIFLIKNTGGYWSEPQKISTPSWSKANKIAIDHHNRLYVFWHQTYNLNTKFVYRYLENGIWSNVVYPYTDSNVYVLENVDIDKNNNIHCIGYFNYYNQTSHDMVFYYSHFDYISNTWSDAFLLNNNRVNNGCDVACDTAALPGLVWGQYTSNSSSDEYATVFKKQDLLGWAANDTVTRDEEYYQKIAIDKNNTVHIIDCYGIPGNNTLTNFNYYTYGPQGWSKEILDENGSIIMYDIETTDQTVDIVYGKLISRPGPDTAKTYFINKSILVGLGPDQTSGGPLALYPVPCREKVTLQLGPYDQSPVSLYVVDLAGKPVKKFFENRVIKSPLTLSWDLVDDGARVLPPGTYLVVCKSRKFVYVRKLIISG